MNFNRIPLKPCAFRNLLIRKGISIEILALLTHLPQRSLTEACAGKVVDLYHQNVILSVLKTHYNIECDRGDIFNAGIP